MPLPARILAVGLLLWLGLLGVVLLVRMRQRGIRVTGLLAHEPSRAGEQVTPERLVAMMVGPAVLASYVVTALTHDLGVTPGGRPILPDLPEPLLTLLTGGNGLYLAGKITRGTLGGPAK